MKKDKRKPGYKKGRVFWDGVFLTPAIFAFAVVILIPFLLLILYQGLNCVKIFRMYRAEQMAELQAEKDSLEAQRKQAEDMMAELQALRAQMASQNQQPAAPPPAAPESPKIEDIINEFANNEEDES